MFKVMIVDDEPMIRKGLQSLIEWDQYNFEVCAVASNGVEAISKYKELLPDLILIDIRMPLMDGIQTISELRKLGSESRIIILSGYGEFQYAQQAIRHRVDGYILKPIDEYELSKLIEDISRKLEDVYYEKEMSSQTLTLLKDEWLSKFVSQELSESELTSEYWYRLFSVEDRELTLVLIDSYGKEHTQATRNQIKQQLQLFISEQGWGEVFSNESYIGILFYHVGMNSSKQDRLVERLNEACQSQVYYLAVLSEELQSIQSLYDTAALMKEQLKKRFFLEPNSLYQLNDLLHAKLEFIEPTITDFTQYIEQTAQRLLYSIDVGNISLVEQLLPQVDQQFQQLQFKEHQIKNNWAQLLTIVMNRLTTQYPKLQLEQELKLVTQLYLANHNSVMLSSLSSQLQLIISRISTNETSNTTVMKQMIDFIDRHYMEPLRLETMAEVFNYNSGYLGKMFKNHTGESFNTYLDQVRIEQAIKWLQEGKKVHQVAELVGYANVDYFHSKFKKYKGVSPSAFKPGSKQGQQPK